MIGMYESNQTNEGCAQSTGRQVCKLNCSLHTSSTVQSEEEVK